MYILLYIIIIIIYIIIIIIYIGQIFMPHSDPCVSPNASFPLHPLYLQYYIKEKTISKLLFLLDFKRGMSQHDCERQEQANRFISIQTALLLLQLKITEHLSHSQVFLSIINFQFLWILTPSSVLWD